MRVFLQHEGQLLGVSSVAVQPNYEFAVASDVAVLRLAIPVTGIAPTPINTTGTPAPGTEGTIVGFGLTGGSNEDFGLKRVGKVTTASCTVVPDAAHVCWDFTLPIGREGEDSNTCYGDSGGPLFIDFGAGSTIAGVTSGGGSQSCLPPDHAFDADVFVERTFIEAQGGADLNNTRCGDISQVGEAGTRVSFGTGTLSETDPAHRWSFDVPAGTVLLRVTLNAAIPNDFDLSVGIGSGRECMSFYGWTFERCEVDAPTPGSWFADVMVWEGAGEYQLTVTGFSACGDGVLAPGEDCDDGNTINADGCDAKCQVEPCFVCSGQPSVCTPVICPACEACDPLTDECVGAPRNDCRNPTEPLKALVLLKDKGGVAKDKLIWKWIKGEHTGFLDFGDPVTTDGYRLCIYEGPGASLLVSADAPPGGNCAGKACWKALGKNPAGSKGYKYKDKEQTPNGLDLIVLKPGGSGKAKVIVEGKGGNLGLPTPLDVEVPVTVQLQAGNGGCWEAQYFSVGVKKNEPDLFKAKAGSPSGAFLDATTGVFD
jgi:cysteine-rich repeat protein